MAFRSAPCGIRKRYRAEPDQAAKSYIEVIEAFPDGIAEALSKRRQPEPA